MVPRLLHGMRAVNDGCASRRPISNPTQRRPNTMPISPCRSSPRQQVVLRGTDSSTRDRDRACRKASNMQA